MKGKISNMDSGWNLENSYTELPEVFFTRISPKRVESPVLVVLNRSLAMRLGLKTDYLKSKAGVEVLVGNSIPEGSDPIAQAYAGHQFGYFTMLGDGRALLIGEQTTPSGEKYDIQLKGSGPTPYSRRGDGRASIGPMLREYIVSEAMHGLGIPTTRSLAVCTTGEAVFRETVQAGAVLARVASSHIRVGTFQYASRWGSKEDLQSLSDYAIKRHFPYIEENDRKYLSLLKEVVKRQAELIAKWQLVGFVHGVMNTDNMAISGETIDYGPCAFMDTYDIDTVFSSIDTEGRYSYGNQPGIGSWNLARFAETLIPLIDENRDIAITMIQEEITGFTRRYRENWISGMRAKLGIFNEEIGDETLAQELLDIMQKYRKDYTNTFRDLTCCKIKSESICEAEEFQDWHKRWTARLERQNETAEDIAKLMKKSNPAIIPRNHRVEEALLAAENGDIGVMEKLLDVIADPYEYSEKQKEYSSPAPPSNMPYMTYCGT